LHNRDLIPVKFMWIFTFTKIRNVSSQAGIS